MTSSVPAASPTETRLASSKVVQAAPTACQSETNHEDFCEIVVQSLVQNEHPASFWTIDVNLVNGMQVGEPRVRTLTIDILPHSRMSNPCDSERSQGGMEIRL